MPRVSKTRRCVRYEPPVVKRASSGNPADLWEHDPEMGRLITFLEHSTELPRTPFQLRSGEFVTDPDTWLAKIREDVNSGTRGARAATGALREDLWTLRELFGKPVVYRGAASILDRPKPR